MASAPMAPWCALTKSMIPNSRVRIHGRAAILNTSSWAPWVSMSTWIGISCPTSARAQAFWMLWICSARARAESTLGIVMWESRSAAPRTIVFTSLRQWGLSWSWMRTPTRL